MDGNHVCLQLESGVTGSEAQQSCRRPTKNKVQQCACAMSATPGTPKRETVASNEASKKKSGIMTAPPLELASRGLSRIHISQTLPRVCGCHRDRGCRASSFSHPHSGLRLSTVPEFSRGTAFWE